MRVRDRYVRQHERIGASGEDHDVGHRRPNALLGRRFRIAGVRNA